MNKSRTNSTAVRRGCWIFKALVVGCPTMLLTILPAPRVLAADEILIADFEGTNYGNWKVTGEAFGPSPAPGQMPVDGFKGKRLVNSFYNGDRTTGTLTSPEFKIERKFIGSSSAGKDSE